MLALPMRPYQDVFEAGARHAALSYADADVQRPVWASMGVKDPTYPDTMYITELIAPHTVSTIPEHTLEALAERGVIVADSITGRANHAQTVLDSITAVGVDLADVFALLENDGVAKFATTWRQLLDAYPTSVGPPKMPGHDRTIHRLQHGLTVPRRSACAPSRNERGPSSPHPGYLVGGGLSPG